MKTVLVTGAHGFIGKNLCAQLELEDDLTVLRYTKSNSQEDLADYLNRADFVFHLAGVNRPKDEAEFNSGNVELTKNILTQLKKSKKITPILVTSSTQSELDNPYGRSKKSAEDTVFEYAQSTGAQAYIYRLPNVFGKWCRPNYNSVVATFCHNIANGIDISINDPSTALKLVYIDDVIENFVSTMRTTPDVAPRDFCEIEQSFNVNLGELANKLYVLRDSRANLLMPDLGNSFDRYLYATFISYFATDDFSYGLDTKHDNRGWLAEFIKSKQFGQVFISRTKPGIARGNHWHHTKIEKFLVIDGNAEIKFRNLNTAEVITYKVSGDELRVLDIPVGYVHSITNVGKTDLLTLFWADEVFDPQKPDTHYEEV